MQDLRQALLVELVFFFRRTAAFPDQIPLGNSMVLRDKPWQATCVSRTYTSQSPMAIQSEPSNMGMDHRE